jgi:hypothetical protein
MAPNASHITFLGEVRRGFFDHPSPVFLSHKLPLPQKPCPAVRDARRIGGYVGSASAHPFFTLPSISLSAIEVAFFLEEARRTVRFIGSFRSGE